MAQSVLFVIVSAVHCANTTSSYAPNTTKSTSMHSSIVAYPTFEFFPERPKQNETKRHTTNNNHNNSSHTQNTTHIHMQTIKQKQQTTAHVPRAVNKLNFSWAQSTARPGFTRFGGLSKRIRLMPEWPRFLAKRASDNSVQTRPHKVPEKAG